MHKNDRKAWYAKTERLGKDHTLKRGERVKDVNGHTGIVVVIEKGVDQEDHGTVAVWQDSRYDYGSDNCEHYCEVDWYKHLRVIE